MRQLPHFRPLLRTLHVLNNGLDSRYITVTKWLKNRTGQGPVYPLCADHTAQYISVRAVREWKRLVFCNNKIRGIVYQREDQGHHMYTVAVILARAARTQGGGYRQEGKIV